MFLTPRKALQPFSQNFPNILTFCTVSIYSRTSIGQHNVELFISLVENTEFTSYANDHISNANDHIISY